jgi:histidinol-phosphate aminotransferase
MLEARAAVKSLHAYRPPLAGRKGCVWISTKARSVVRRVYLARLRGLDAEVLARYPEREPVEAGVADFLGLDAAQVLLTNGVDEAIHLLCSTYLEAGDEAIIVVPTFAMYAIFAQAEGARLVQVRSGENFAFPLEETCSPGSANVRG